MPDTFRTLPCDSNQALGIGQYAVDCLQRGSFAPSDAVLEKVEQFHRDSIGCAVAALATKANAPTLLQAEAAEYPDPRGTFCFGSRHPVKPEKAVVANCSAVRELDANGTNFGFNPRTGYTRGEFGHNDFYPVVLAATRPGAPSPVTGERALQAMLCLDEIRGRLAEVFSLKTYKIDHVVHGAVSSAAVYGALRGATPAQIESAIGLVVAHFIPFRAIRHGEQLSDSKGASAALSAEVAVLGVERALRGFVGPADIFRNPQAIFRLFEPTERGTSPFDLSLATAGDDFAVMGMHFKLGLYEHQSAGAIQGLLDVLAAHPQLLAESPDEIRRLKILIYEPALGIIGDPHKRDPRTRQSADHSMVYIIATLLRKAFQISRSGWRELMLVPADYDDAALFDPLTRRLMDRIEFAHGGTDYDARYPDGIPTSLEFDHARLGRLASGLVMYPLGHARNTSDELTELLAHKFRTLASLGPWDVEALHARFSGLRTRTAEEIADLYATWPLAQK